MLRFAFNPLIDVSQTPCSPPHKGVRKRTRALSHSIELASAERNKSINLRPETPLAPRMLLFQPWKLVSPPPSNVVNDAFAQPGQKNT